MADIANLGFKVESSQLKKAVGDLNDLSVSATVAAQATEKLSSSTRKNSTATSGETAEIRKETVAINRRKAQIALETAELKKQTAELRHQKAVRAAAIGTSRRVERTATGVDPLTGKMARDLGVNRFNTANIAAQFQDIGVTAAMGMNPMTIALQQGTQLSAILNNMGNPLKGLAQAFSQLINPVALLSIGITGLIAAFVQMVDWGKVWERASGLIADGLDFLADNFYAVAIAAGTFLAVQIITHLGAILTSVKLLTVGLVKMGAAWVVAMGPVGWTIAGLTALGVALKVFREEIRNVLGFDLVTGIKDVLNALITTFANGLKVITNVFKLWWNELKNKVAEAANFMIGVAEKIEVGSAGITAFLDNGENLSKRIAEYEGMKQEIKKMLTVNDDMVLNPSDYLLEGVENPLESVDYVGKALDTGADLLHKAADKIRNSGNEVADEMKKAWDKIVKGIEGHKIEMFQESDLIGRIGEDYYITKEKYDLLNQAREAGITLTAEQMRYIEDSAVSLGQEANALDLLKQRFDFAHSSTTSFFTDMNHALIEGQTLWEAFGNAVTNVLTKILDKITEIGVDQLFAAGKASGWFGLGSKGTQVYASAAEVGSFLPQATGGVWSNGIQKFATGGVVGSATMFGTRSGLGLMGEAGPEAIMPLTRGANGELGVKAEGTATAPVVVNVINNSNAKATVNQRQTSQGTEIDVMIDQLVADKLGTLGTASNTAMNTWNNRQLIAR